MTGPSPSKRRRVIAKRAQKPRRQKARLGGAALRVPPHAVSVKIEPMAEGAEYVWVVFNAAAEGKQKT